MLEAVYAKELPVSRLYDFQSLPDDTEIVMEFRLVYRGPLKSATASNPRPREKHQIRKQLHIQIRQFWREHPHLKMLMERSGEFGNPESAVTNRAKDFRRGPHGFVPLVRRQEDSFCALNILFLRRGTPGKIVDQGGDLDNRLKTLFDALKVPDTTRGLPEGPEPDFDPMFCLLQDDSQITSLSVTTDRILFPQSDNEGDEDVVLVIHVHVYRGTNAAQVTGLSGNVN